MSLQIWLPLTGNTINKGVYVFPSEFIVHNSSCVTVNDSGKIGKCYNFDSTVANEGIRNNDSGFMAKCINNHSFSLCAWFQTTATDTCLLSLSYGLRMFVGDGAHTYVTLYNSSRTVGCAASMAVNDGKWHHMCASYNVNTNKISIYIDGVRKNEVSYTSGYTYASSWTNGLFVGRDPNNSTLNDHYHFRGKINDVRVYDHALSLAEIKEISKGLALHYKLDTPFAITNEIRNATYTPYNNYSSAGFTATVTNTGRTYDGCKIYRLTYTPGSDETKLNNVKTSLANHGIMGFRRTFLANTKYCFWILCKPISHPDTIVGGTASNISGWTEISMRKYTDDWYIVGQCRKGNVTTDKTDSIFTSFKTPSAEAGVPITIDFCCPHLLVGYDSIIPEYDYLGTDPDVTDSSGYGNHGTKSGDISVSETTPRYSMSTAFDGSTSYIEADPLPLETATISIWVKTSWTSSSGYRLAVHDKTTGLAIGWSGSNLITYVGSSNGSTGTYISMSNTSYAANVWNHIVVVKTGDKTRNVYVNGVLASASGGNYWGGDMNKLHIGARHFNSVYSAYFNGQLSDFRAYTTQLSADDVLALYNIGAKVSDKGEMMGYEMKEG